MKKNKHLKNSDNAACLETLVFGWHIYTSVKENANKRR
jgi:hypothetical protein